MPNESEPRALRVTLSPRIRSPASRSGSSTPSRDNPRAAPHSLGHQTPNGSSKPRVGAFVHKVRPSQPAAEQQSIGVRLSSKSSYAAQCAAVAPPRVRPKVRASRHVPDSNVTPQRQIASRKGPMKGTPAFGKLELAVGQAVRLDLSETEETQSGCSLSDCCLGFQSGRGSSDTSTRFEIVAIRPTEISSKGIILGDTNSTCSGSSTPRIDGNRSQSDELSAAIAVARFAASRWSIDLGSTANGSGNRHESDLYVDCATLKWRVWMKEMSREEGQQCATEAALAPHTASFAAHLLWQHDRAISDAERYNALCRESRVQTVLAEEALSRLEQSVSADASRKQSREAAQKLECLEALEQQCALESARSQHLKFILEQSECKKDSLHLTLAETADSLHRSAEAYENLSTRLANLDEEANAQSEIVHALRHELNDSRNAVVDDRTAELAQELQRMNGLYEMRQAEMQEMIARSVELTSNKCSAQTFGQRNAEKVREVSVQTDPGSISIGGTKNLMREVDSLQDLVNKLAEEMGRLHSSHNEVTHEKDAVLKERNLLRKELEEVEALNSNLQEKAQRLRSPRDQVDALPPRLARLRNGRATIPQGQLLAEVLACENRRLRTTTRSIGGQSGL